MQNATHTTPLVPLFNWAKTRDVARVTGFAELPEAIPIERQAKAAAEMGYWLWHEMEAGRTFPPDVMAWYHDDVCCCILGRWLITPGDEYLADIATKHPNDPSAALDEVFTREVMH